MTSIRTAALAAVLVALAATVPSIASPQAAPPAEWRSARWGMTLEEVLKAFPGEAQRLDAPVKLADGNVVAAGIDAFVIAGTTFRVRFVFDADGKLVLVSLRTSEREYAKPELLAPIEKALAGSIGPATTRSADDQFIDMRQVTWKGPTGRVDLKYIPGTIAVVHAAPSQQPPTSGPAEQ